MGLVDFRDSCEVARSKDSTGEGVSGRDGGERRD